MTKYSSYDDEIPGTWILVLDDSLSNVNSETEPAYSCLFLFGGQFTYFPQISAILSDKCKVQLM